MNAGAAAGVRAIQGVLAVGDAPGAGGLTTAFVDQFGQSPAGGAAGLVITASNAVIGKGASLWSQGRCVFWDSRRNAYVRVDDARQLDAIAAGIRSGAAWPALDDCVVFQDDGGILLFASGAGATTLYYYESGGFLSFANRPQALRDARRAPIDRLGVGEIVRFGANYGQRTLLSGIKRVPFGHLLECAPGQPARQRAFMDYSHRPQESRDEHETREAICAALDCNLRLIEGSRDLLFSGGVDSALLALRGAATGTIETGWFYSVGDEDPEREVARAAAETIGLELEFVRDNTTPSDIARRIGAYALPTLDFSIVPTHALGSAVVAARGRTTFIDGTGGDAWFGFGSLAHSETWRSLHRLRGFAPLARKAYLALLPWENRRQLRPLKGLARVPEFRSAALGHMCANPVYSTLLDLRSEEWRQIEEEIVGVLNGLTAGQTGADASEVIVSDACLIAVAQFAAKTSQWDIAGQGATFYPFLMPNMVAIGRTMPARLLIRDGSPKPLLKDIVAASALGHDFAYRRKSGFQPPLQKLLQREHGGDAVLVSPNAEEAPWTATARALPRRLLRGRNTLRIGGLYAIWSRIVVELWLKSLRQ